MANTLLWLKKNIFLRDTILYLNKKNLGYNYYCSSIKSNMTEASIRKKLQEKFNPVHMDVINESYMHNVPKGSETHFKVVVVSDKFENLPLIKRHRLINELLNEELQSNVHALSIVAKTPSQWQESTKVIEPSPNCRGGFGK